MQTLIHDLLEYSRIDARPRPFKRVPIFVRSSTIPSAGGVHTCIECQDHLRRVTSGGRLLPIGGTDAKPYAIKFHNRETSHIDVRARRRDHEWICPTRDNGIGIDPEFHERIFDIFQRPHSQQA